MTDPRTDTETSRAARFEIVTVVDYALEIVPGRSERDWMDATAKGFARRCLPMLMANATGWEILSPCTFAATWDGGTGKGALTVRALDAYARLDDIAQSHFGEGILTFRTGHLYRTDPGWAVWLRGAPNYALDGIAPLEGLIESDWLPFTSTMNWRFLRPGTVTFRKDDPIAFLTPIPHLSLDAIQPTLTTLSDDPAFARRFEEWRQERTAFNEALERREPDAVRRGWQKNYTQGILQDGSAAPETHLLKRRLKNPTS